jgi:hypothetical protein
MNLSRIHSQPLARSTPPDSGHRRPQKYVDVLTSAANTKLDQLHIAPGTTTNQRQRSELSPPRRIAPVVRSRDGKEIR